MKRTDEAVIVTETFTLPIAKVWNAISELEEMKVWFFENIPTFEAKEGFETTFTVQVEDRIYPHVWKLTKVIPLQNITYDWRYEGYNGVSIVTFDLIEIEHQTTLTVTSTVIEDFADDIPEFKRESCLAGWNYFIKNRLKEYLNTTK